ncbi:NUDIX domain-containing protein [Candidatus Fermentibacteria bacterium]|nr:NUDIX domain-containing protein [Candidatus Fermentibacteria bacterium]
MKRGEPYASDPRAGSLRRRNSAKAVVCLDGRILFTVNRDRLGEFLLLPGGGQRFGETLEEALVRETLEETGWVVEPGALVLVREYIGGRHEFADEDGDVHQVEFMFLARAVVRRRGEPGEGDAWQTGVRWLPPGSLPGRRIYPSVLERLLGSVIDGSYRGPVYLGAVN